MFAVSEEVLSSAYKFNKYVSNVTKPTDPYYIVGSSAQFNDAGEYSGAYYQTTVHIPASASFNDNPVDVSVYLSSSTSGAKTMTELFPDGKSAGRRKMLTTVYDLNLTSGSISSGTSVKRIEIEDWDDMLAKSYVVESSAVEAGAKDVFGLKFTEYGTADSRYLLTTGKATAVKCSTLSAEALMELADLYSVDPSDIATDSFARVTYTLARDDDQDQQFALAVVNSNLYNENNEVLGVRSDANAITTYANTWALYLDYATKKFVLKSNYGVGNSKEAIKPWQVGLGDSVEKMYAISSTEVFSDPTGKWKDGYTASCKNDTQPGNGDVESYQSNKTNQLIISSIGPGEFGNDVGISIITPEAALVPALYNQNAFSWLYRYDDEDKVNDSGLDYRSNPNNLTWKKVYRINVYVKTPSKTQSVWGFGLDALTSSPVESWYVSNDPNAKDENGNSLWAPYVINGNSQYIYVSKKSVESSVDYHGNYAMPAMTWSIYQMTGGANSKLNNVKEKTKALDLYKNRKRAYFDYLFNVEPVDTFSGKQKYMAMMNRIGQLAMARKIDLGIIQCTSKEAKTLRLKLSEGKMFSFSDGSYVAGYDGYDSYFDPFTSTWVMLPKSVAGAVACCYADNYDKPWMAPAGVANGRIQYSSESMVGLEEDEFGELYSININTSLNYPGYGEVLMGQKTMLKKESALNRIDVRKLCNYIEKRLENKLLPFLYQKNTPTNRSTMRTTVDSFLGRIQAGQGIKSRKVDVIPDPKDTHLVYVKIAFVPAESIERIEVVLILNRETGTITAEEQ